MVCFRLLPEEAERIKQFQQNHDVYRILLGKHLGFDHNHTNGACRGYLDWRVNRAYGLLEQVYPHNLPEALRALATFHEHPPATLALGETRYGLIGKALCSKKTKVYGPLEAPVIKKRKAQ